MVRTSNKKGPNPKADFGARLRQRRKAVGLAAKDLARLANVSPSYISQLEHGRQEHPSLDVLNALATGLGVAASDLLGEAPPQGGVYDVPPALQALATEMKLDDEVVTMLSAINLHGQRPSTRDGWRLIFLAIQHACLPPIALDEVAARKPLKALRPHKKGTLAPVSK